MTLSIMVGHTHTDVPIKGQELAAASRPHFPFLEYLRNEQSPMRMVQNILKDGKSQGIRMVLRPMTNNLLSPNT
jgi:hypothetical protein